MKLKPCPCTSLQKGCQILAIIDAVINMISLGLMVLAFVLYLRHDADEELSQKEKNVGLVSAAINMIVCLMRIGLAFRLYYGSLNRDRRQCMIWLFITVIVTTINFVSMIVSVSASEFSGSSFGGALVGILYNLYEILVVVAFLQEMKRDRQNLGDSIGYVTAQPVPQHHQPPPPYFTGQGTLQSQDIYVIPASQSQNSYPMQQLSSVNNSYPAPVHVTKT